MARDSENSTRRRLRGEQPLSRLFPNLITIAGLCCGLSAIRFAMVEKWEISVAFILAAALIDGMDGRIARMLGATSIFGAQLDSLSDFLCFGVAPAIVMYMWQLESVKGLGWAVVLLYAVCCALRLARFNTGMINDSQQKWQKQFFIGVPSPAGGILCLLPLILNLQSQGMVEVPPHVSIAYVACVAVLMASRVPTFAAKNVRIKHELILPITVLLACLVVMFIIETWLTICVLSVIYLCIIPVSWSRWQKLKKQSEVGG